MKILITEPEYFPEASRKIFEEIGKVVAKRMTRSGLLSEMPDTDVLVIRIETKVDRAVIDAAPRLKIIASATTGLDHIAVDYAKARGIRIINLPRTHTVPTAEHTFALILSLARKISWAHNSLSEGKWERYRFVGQQLSGKRLGIIGFGKIGRQVARYAKAFGMHVLAHDPYAPAKLAKAAGVELVSLDRLLKGADFVSIHAPLTDETRAMLGTKEFAKMKPSALLVNTARAQIVDTRALLAALQSSRIAGAAVDVFEDEPATSSDPLVKYAKSHGNLLMTPHLGASTAEAVNEASIHIAGEVVKALGERRP